MREISNGIFFDKNEKPSVVVGYFFFFANRMFTVPFIVVDSAPEIFEYFFVALTAFTATFAFVVFCMDHYDT